MAHRATHQVAHPDAGAVERFHFRGDAALGGIVLQGGENVGVGGGVFAEYFAEPGNKVFQITEIHAGARSRWRACRSQARAAARRAAPPATSPPGRAPNRPDCAIRRPPSPHRMIRRGKAGAGRRRARIAPGGALAGAAPVGQDGIPGAIIRDGQHGGAEIQGGHFRAARGAGQRRHRLCRSRHPGRGLRAGRPPF